MQLREYSIFEKQSMYILFLDQESLFRALDPCLDDVQIGAPMKVISKIEDWDEAKRFLAYWFAGKYPEKVLNYQIQMLREKCQTLDCWVEGLGHGNMTPLKSASTDAELYTILLYAKVILDAMSRLDNAGPYAALSECLKNYLQTKVDICREDALLQEHLASAFDRGEIVADYDYVKNLPLCQEEEKRVEPAKVVAEEEYDGEPIDFQSKQVPLEIMKQLFECAGVDFGINGTQKPAAQLISDLTGIPYNTCKNYLSSGSINRKLYQKEIDKANAIIKQLQLDIKL